LKFTIEEWFNRKKEAAPFLELAPREQCKDLAHLETVFQNIVDKGGEGVILRDPNAPFEQGRSRGYLKHKVIISLLIFSVAYSWADYSFFH